MTALAKTAQSDAAAGLRQAERLLRSHPLDPRLHFLAGSLLAALQRYGEAQAPMRRAIEIAPDYQIARFQLGLLLLSSGLADQAIETWRPLFELPQDDALRLFAEGLQLMAQDDFVAAERQLRAGLARNLEHPALNPDIEMVIERMREKVQGAAPEDESSPAHWLLQVAASKQTKH